MRAVIIVLAVGGLVFVAFMLIASNEPQPATDPASERYEPPAILKRLGTARGAPRLVTTQIRFPRESGSPLAYGVLEACGTPARLATVALAAGTNVRVAYACEPQPAERSCSGPARLCRQTLCLVGSEAERSLSSCEEDLTFVGEANLSIGPEPGRITISAPAGQPAEVLLR